MPFLTICVVRPCVKLLRFWMVDQLKDFYDALPNGFTLERLFDWNAFNVARFDAVKLANDAPQFR